MKWINDLDLSAAKADLRMMTLLAPGRKHNPRFVLVSTEPETEGMTLASNPDGDGLCLEATSRPELFNATEVNGFKADAAYFGTRCKAFKVWDWHQKTVTALRNRIMSLEFAEKPPRKIILKK